MNIERRGGLSIGWLAVPAVGMLVGMWSLSDIMAKGMARPVGQGEKKTVRMAESARGSVEFLMPRSALLGERAARPDVSSAEFRSELPAVTVREVPFAGRKFALNKLAFLCLYQS